MNVRLYANSSTLALTERLEGGSFQPPSIPAYQDIQMRLKLVETVNSVPTPDARPLHALTARIGWPEASPVSGQYQLEISLGGDAVTTADIAYDAAASAIKSAIDAALGSTIATLNPCTVTTYEGLHRIVFADKSLRPTFACVENALWPESFVEADEIEFDEGYAYVLSLRQAPVAETTAVSAQVPAAPVVTEKQPGGEIDGYVYNAIQKLAISPAFEGGSFRLVRNGIKTVPIAVPTNIAAIRTALDPLKDEGGIWVVTETANGVFIEFSGEMGGEVQELLGVEVFDSPGVDYFFHLPTKTDAMRTLLRQVDTSGQIRIPLSLQLRITDALAADGYQDVTIQQELTFVRPVPSSANNVAASLRWNQPLSKGDYLKHSTSSLLVGNRAMKFTIGDGSTISFALPHNLVENPNAVTANATTNKLAAVDHNYQDLDPVTFSSTGTLPAPLDATKTYFVLNASADDFQVSLTPNGSAVDLTSAGSGTHTARLKDGTVEHVAVEVWETGGSEARLPQSDYTVVRTSLDVVTVSGFPATPTNGQYDVLIQTYGRPATYQAHQHEIDETPEAKLRIEALEARVALLEQQSGSGIPFQTVQTGLVGPLTRPLGIVWRVPRARTLPPRPATLLDWRVTAEDLGATPARPIRLQPAIHDAVVTALPATLPNPATSKGSVFSVGTARPELGGLKAGDFVASSGLELFRAVNRPGTSSYYPAAFELTLFETAINPLEFPVKSTLQLLCGIELMMLALAAKARDRRSSFQWTLLLEAGVPTADASPGTPGANLAAAFANPIILLEQRLILTEIPIACRFGCKIVRAGDGSMTARWIYNGRDGELETAPTSVPLALRSRLAWGDTENAPADPRAIVAARGLDVGMDGQPDPTLGKLIIT